MPNWEKTKLTVNMPGEEIEDVVEMIDVHEEYDVEPDMLIEIKHANGELIYLDAEDFSDLVCGPESDLPIYTRIFDKTGKVTIFAKTKDLMTIHLA